MPMPMLARNKNQSSKKEREAVEGKKRVSYCPLIRRLTANEGYDIPGKETFS